MTHGHPSPSVSSTEMKVFTTIFQKGTPFSWVFIMRSDIATITT